MTPASAADGARIAAPRAVAVVANLHKAGAAELIRRLVAECARAGIAVRVEAESGKLAGLSEGNGITLHTLKDAAAAADVVIVLGGDGTILGVARELGQEAIRPLAGINTGALGFLTAATSSDAADFVGALASADFRISRRAMIEAVRVAADGTFADRAFGLNESVISRGAISRIISLEARIDGQLLNRFNGDGLIISTPTGSTAYSLSAGGPITAPEAGVFVVTPICPHALASRSVVVADRAEIEISRTSGHDPDQNVVVTIDGQNVCRIEQDESLLIRKASFCLPLVTRSRYDFYAVLQQKLHWRGSAV